jgi:hypothetical protein
MTGHFTSYETRTDHELAHLNRVQFETDSRALGCVPHSSYMAIFP